MQIYGQFPLRPGRVQFRTPFHHLLYSIVLTSLISLLDLAQSKNNVIQVLGAYGMVANAVIHLNLVFDKMANFSEIGAVSVSVVNVPLHQFPL